MGCSLFDVEQKLLDFFREPKDVIQSEETVEMEELRDLVGDSFPEDLVRIYGGRNRILEKFLIATDNKPKEAYEKLKKCQDILNQYGYKVDRDNEEELKKYQFFLDLWPIQFSGVSKTGNVILYSQLLKIKPKEFISGLSLDEMKRFFILYGIESMKIQNFCNYFYRDQSTTKWKGTIEIFDMNKISLKQLHISGLRVLVKVLKVGQDLFPDTLEKSFIINAPWYFTAAWKVIRLGLNKSTLERVTISKGNCLKELTELVGSEEVVKQIIAGKGGPKTWNFHESILK